MHIKPKSERAAAGEGFAFRYGRPFEEGRQPAVILKAQEHVSKSGNQCLKISVGLTGSGTRADVYIMAAGGGLLDNVLGLFAPGVAEAGGELDLDAFAGRTCEVDVETEEDNYFQEGGVKPRVRWFFAAPDAPDEAGNLFGDDADADADGEAPF